jgi:hypothetical protein
MTIQATLERAIEDEFANSPSQFQRESIAGFSNRK